MKLKILRFRASQAALIAALAVVLGTGKSYSQNALENAVQQLSSANVRGYLQPFVDGFGANMNSGLFHSASIGNLDFHVQFQVVAMGTLIGDAEKYYDAMPPEPFAQTPVRTATVFGPTGSTVRGPAGLSYHFQNGQIRTTIIPSAIPQMVIGDIMGTQAVVRYMETPEIQDFPRSSMLGFGLRHSISRYIPDLPVDIAAGAAYQKLTIGSIMDATSLSFGAQVSKSFSVLTLYSGLQYESADMTLNYEYTGPGSTPGSTISLQLQSENKVRFTGGLSLNLYVLNLNGDISVGKVTALSGGIGFGF